MDNMSFDTIVKDIIDNMAKQKDRVIAEAFVLQIGQLLKDNGIVPHFTETEYDEAKGNEFIKHYGVVFDALDCSEHDKLFQDEIRKLQNEISNIKSRCAIEATNDFKNGNYNALKIVRTGDYEALKKINDELVKENTRLNRELQEMALEDNLPYDPISVAEFLINKTEKYEHNTFMKAFTGNEQGTYNIYGISELRQIAEHLLVYCNNNKGEG